MTKSAEKISDTAVKKATGKNWQQWIRLLDRAGGKKLDHKQIVQLVGKRLASRPARRSLGGGGSSTNKAWWSQMITVEYERRRGKRKLGQTADADYQIGVSKTLPLSKKQAWDLLMSRSGKKIWHGRGVKSEVRTKKTGERLRMTWESSLLRKPSVLQLTVMSSESGRGARIGFHQEKLSSQAERAKMKRHWQKALISLADLAD